MWTFSFTMYIIRRFTSCFEARCNECQGKDVKAEAVWSYLCNSCCFLSPLISLHTLNAVTFCQQHLISSRTLRDSCNTLSSLHISSSSAHRHYHTVILTTSVKTICELTVTYQRKWHYKSWLTLWKSYCVCDLSFWKFLRVGSRCKETSEENNNNNMWIWNVECGVSGHTLT